MELLDERPVWSMSGSEALTALDHTDAVLAHVQTRRLHLIARLEDLGYAEEIGAHDTARLVAFRYRMNPTDAGREVRLARALPKYRAVSEALAAQDDSGGEDGDLDTGVDTGVDLATADGEGEVGGGSADGMTRMTRWLLRVAQAEAIVSSLERVASRVSLDDRDVIERQLVNLAGHLSPQELRKAGKELCDLVDSDGPEPDENKAYERESLKLSLADNGVKFSGYLANENAELLRSLTHAGAKPRKTVTGEFDPRPRDKRQADALSAALSIAAAATDAGFPTSTATARTGSGRAAATSAPPTDTSRAASPTGTTAAASTASADAPATTEATDDATTTDGTAARAAEATPTWLPMAPASPRRPCPPTSVVPPDPSALTRQPHPSQPARRPRSQPRLPTPA